MVIKLAQKLYLVTIAHALTPVLPLPPWRPPGRFQAQRRAAGGGVRTGRRRVRRMAAAAQAQGRRRWRGARFRADQNRTDEGFCTK